jgi:hypothetical protein
MVGGEMIVYGARLDDGNGSSTRAARGMAYTPATNRWHVLAIVRLSPQASTIAALDGRAIAWDYLLGAAGYDPRSNRWTRLPNVPLRASECYPTSTTVARTVIGWYCGTGAALRAAAHAWQRLQPPRAAPPLDGPIAAGRVALFIGVPSHGAHAQLWAYRPS